MKTFNVQMHLFVQTGGHARPAKMECTDCDLGYYSAGGTPEVPYPDCQSCPMNMTTALVNSTERKNGIGEQLAYNPYLCFIG